MKKLIAMLCLMAMLFSLTACGSDKADGQSTKTPADTAAIEKALSDMWRDTAKVKAGDGSSYTVRFEYIFKEAGGQTNVSATVAVSFDDKEFTPVVTSLGKYTVEADCIKIDWVKNSVLVEGLGILPEKKIPYTFKNGDLKLKTPDGKDMQRMNIKFE